MDLLIFMYWVSGFLFVMLITILIFYILAILKLRKAYDKDMAVMIDKANRYEIIELPLKLSDKKSFTYSGGTYYFKQDAGILTKLGKVLYIYSVGKPLPMVIKHNSSEWLDSSSMRGIVNNDVVRDLFAPEDKMKDSLLMLGMLSAIGGAVITLIIALKIFGVLK